VSCIGQISISGYLPVYMLLSIALPIQITERTQDCPREMGDQITTLERESPAFKFPVILVLL